MNRVKIRYRPIQFIPVYRTIYRNIPAQWKEINQPLLINISLFQHGLIAESKALARLFNISHRLAKKLHRYHKYRLFQLFEFISKLKAHESFIIKQLGKYKAPDDRLRGVSFGCFIFAESYCTNYYNDNNITDLDKLIACLYREKPFNEYEIDQRAIAIHTIPFGTKKAILLNYLLIKQWLAQQFPYVFIKPLAQDETKPEKPEKKKKKLKSNWVFIFDSIVGDDLINGDKIAALPATHVLRYLNNKERKRRNHGS